MTLSPELGQVLDIFRYGGYHLLVCTTCSGWYEDLSYDAWTLGYDVDHGYIGFDLEKGVTSNK